MIEQDAYENAKDAGGPPASLIEAMAVDDTEAGTEIPEAPTVSAAGDDAVDAGGPPDWLVVEVTAQEEEPDGSEAPPEVPTPTESDNARPAGSAPLEIEDAELDLEEAGTEDAVNG